ncbi:hypothetical protein HPO96_25680 [Kribbella sandramycini]|uniref:Guanylate cyclase domain-containing protein n=1 Tax=Kribbella sandramycini TaxID=60450 RepID=A0A7Y4L3I4_9ACTN|nr:hypothetical protein [Kribbella sandramycini]MBB6570496.1 hypothetical protein [Kribbella sandramycini]NOL43642.1 hypothetical protein [Kribbella sandramycini]
MSTPQDPRYTGVSELPPYRALLVVDMKDYSGNAGRDQTELTQLIPEVMEAAFERAGLARIWARKTFHNGTGDGYAIGLPPELLPHLLKPYLSALQEELEDRNSRRPHYWNGPMRFRVSVNLGPIADSGANQLGDGSGAERVVLHRLLDSDPVRHLLAGSDPEVTQVAAIISRRVYEDAVLARFADDPASLYVEAGAEVKTYQGLAYLRVPKPSGDLLSRGFLKPPRGAESGAPATPAAPAPPSGGFGVQINGSSGPIYTGSGTQNNTLYRGPER